jgi:hypothetical protein
VLLRWRELPDRAGIVLSTAAGSSIEITLPIQRQCSPGWKHRVVPIDRGGVLPPIVSRQPKNVAVEDAINATSAASSGAIQISGWVEDQVIEYVICIVLFVALAKLGE